MDPPSVTPPSTPTSTPQGSPGPRERVCGPGRPNTLGRSRTRQGSPQDVRVEEPPGSGYRPELHRERKKKRWKRETLRRSARRFRDEGHPRILQKRALRHPRHVEPRTKDLYSCDQLEPGTRPLKPGLDDEWDEKDEKDRVPQWNLPRSRLGWHRDVLKEYRLLRDGPCDDFDRRVPDPYVRRTWDCAETTRTLESLDVDDVSEYRVSTSSRDACRHGVPREHLRRTRKTKVDWEDVDAVSGGRMSPGRHRDNQWQCRMCPLVTKGKGTRGLLESGHTGGTCESGQTWVLSPDDRAHRLFGCSSPPLKDPRPPICSRTRPVPHATSSDRGRSR